jgi:hypothetical protein
MTNNDGDQSHQSHRDNLIQAVSRAVKQWTAEGKNSTQAQPVIDILKARGCNLYIEEGEFQGANWKNPPKLSKAPEDPPKEILQIIDEIKGTAQTTVTSAEFAQLVLSFI